MLKLRHILFTREHVEDVSLQQEQTPYSIPLHDSNSWYHWHSFMGIRKHLAALEMI